MGEGASTCTICLQECGRTFSKIWQFALQSQAKRAAYSISLNIVEGCGRNTDKDFVHFLDISLGSAQELEYCMLLALDLEYLNREKFDIVNKMVNEVKAMLINLIKAIRK